MTDDFMTGGMMLADLKQVQKLLETLPEEIQDIRLLREISETQELAAETLRLYGPDSPEALEVAQRLEALTMLLDEAIRRLVAEYPPEDEET